MEKDVLNEITTPISEGAVAALLHACEDEHGPGCVAWWSDDGKILYIGKRKEEILT